MSQLVDQLPDLNNEFPIPLPQAEQYRRDGHTLVRGVCTRAECDAYVGPIGEALEAHRKERRALAERDTYHKAFIQVGNLWVKDERVKRFVLARRFAHIAAQLMGVSGVRIYHDQALFKEPGGGPTPWHQDQYYWPIASHNTITMWMPLEDARVESGAMIFASGIHERGSLTEMAISDASAQFFMDISAQEEWPLRTYELKAGDATFHSGWTPHKAPGNSTDKLRPVMTVIYMADGVKVAEPANEHQPMDMKVFFPGCKPGDLAATELNPLVYP